MLTDGVEIRQIVMAAMELWGAIVIAIALFWAIITREQLGDKKNLIVELFLCTSVWLLADAVAWGARGGQSDQSYWLVRVSNGISCIMPHILIAIYSVYISKYTGGVEMWTVLVHNICTLGVIFVIAQQFHPMFYAFDEHNRYYRLGLHWVMQVPGLTATLITIFVLIRKRKEAGESFNYLLSFVVLPIIAATLQTFIYGYSFLNIAVTVSVVLLFLRLLREQNLEYIRQHDEMIRQREELQDMRFRLVKTQVQPHFIFNCLNTIYYLCDSDPEKAKTSIGVFARFLRGSLKIIDSDEMVAFDKEMEHVDQYLKLEQMRFEDRLKVEKDIRETGFGLPALTVQVLVENAVKHGVCKKPEGGTVRISTFREGKTAVIRVVDDGVGFDMEKVGADSTGLRTSRARLKGMCGGTLSIESSPGNGTAAEIRVPIQKRPQI